MFLSQVGEPMMITVSEASDVTAFKSYAAPLVTAAASPAPASPPPTKVIPAAVCHGRHCDTFSGRSRIRFTSGIKISSGEGS